MIHHAWSVLCGRSSIDSESNVVSLFDVVEEITVDGVIDKLGVLPGPYDLVSLWSREKLDEPAEGEARWSLVTPKGRTMRQKPGVLDLGSFHRVRLRTRLA